MDDARRKIGDLLERHERGVLDRTQLIEGLVGLTRTSESAPGEEDGESLRAVSVNHIAISVGDLERAKCWYRDLFYLRVLQESDKIGRAHV